MRRTRGPWWNTRRRSLLAVGAALGLLIATAGVTRPASAATPAPAFVQQTSGHVSAGSLAITPTQVVSTGDRLIVQVAIWSSGNATVRSVSDTAGNTWTRLTSTVASDYTELSSWTAPVTAGGGTRPAITVTATGIANIGASLLDYAGVSTASGVSVLDVSRSATGTTGSAAATVATGVTTATTAGPELAVGLYADSGFSDSLTAGSGWTPRVNVSPTGVSMELLAEDQIVNVGGTPNATFGTGPNTPWLAAILVLKSSSWSPTAPTAPTAVTATPGNNSATISWTAPPDGGSPISSYAVTPYAAGV